MTKPDPLQATDLSPYLNRWIAVVRERVVGVGLNREQAYRAAKRSRPKEKPQLWFVDGQGQVQETEINLRLEMSNESSWFDKYPLLQETVQYLRQQQVEAYLVGGAVRDLLLGRQNVTDFDFVVPSDGLIIARQVANTLKAAFYPLDPERKTGRVVLTMPDSGKTYLDFATYRGDTLEADLADRDFTVNAIALSLADSPQLVDPLKGRAALIGRQIKAASPTAFQRDPIRVLRAVRQAIEFGFTIESASEQLLRQAAPQLPQVSPERQRDELLKLLTTPRPGQAVQLLHRLEILPHFLPEIEALIGVSQSAPHYLDVFDHTTAALDIWADMSHAGWVELPQSLRGEVEQYLETLLTGDLPQRNAIALALLLHDTGKAQTRSEEITAAGVRVRFPGHEQVSAKIVRRVMARFRFSSQAADFIERIVAHHMRPLLLSIEKKIGRKAIYRLFRDTSGPTYQAGVAMTLHSLADHRATYLLGQGQAEEQALLNVIRQLITAYFEQRDQVIDPPPLLSGHDLIALGLAEGPQLGQLLQALKEAQAAGQITDKTAALAFIKAQAEFAHRQTDEL